MEKLTTNKLDYLLQTDDELQELIDKKFSLNNNTISIQKKIDKRIDELKIIAENSNVF